MARELGGRAAARLAVLLAVPLSRSTALRLLRRLPLPEEAVPRVIGVDDFALRRRHRYATIIVDAETGRRVAVLPDREMATLESWPREHGSGIAAVCRGGSATYTEAIRRALPDTVQVSGRWHLWHNLCDTTQPELRAHTGCWATINPPRPGGARERTTRERWNKIHSLLGQGAGLLDCFRRLNVALPHPRSFTSGLTIDRPAVNAGLTPPHHNGGTEGVNNKAKLIKRQMYGRAGFPLLRHRVLLG